MPETLARMTEERAAELKAMCDDPNFAVDTSDIREWSVEDFKNAILRREMLDSIKPTAK